MPEIILYSDFIFQFPNAVYLEPAPKEDPLQSICREMLQDIMNSLKQSLVKDHIIKRIKPEGALEKTEQAIASLLQDQRKAAEDVVSNMESQVNEIVIDSLKNIFKFKSTNKAINLKLETVGT